LRVRLSLWRMHRPSFPLHALKNADLKEWLHVLVVNL
jgi:hypothetical protein